MPAFHVPGLKKTQHNKETAREEVRDEVLTWYLLTAGKAPVRQCLDEKSYDSKSVWFLEPLLPGTNPCVVEEEKLDGHWTIRIEPMEEKIRVFGSGA